MRARRWFPILAAAWLAFAGTSAAWADGTERIGWKATTLAEALFATSVFSMLGIILAVLGFKIFDWLTPGDLQGQVIEKQNVAAGILSGAVILGICLIIAASML